MPDSFGTKAAASYELVCGACSQSLRIAVVMNDPDLCVFSSLGQSEGPVMDSVWFCVGLLRLAQVVAMVNIQVLQYVMPELLIHTLRAAWADWDFALQPAFPFWDPC